MKTVQVFVTVPDASVGRSITSALLSERLAACVTAIPEVVSRYWWRGRVRTTKEILLSAKTTLARLPAFMARVKELHPYEVPEIVAVPIISGSPEYLDWVAHETRASGKRRA